MTINWIEYANGITQAKSGDWIIVRIAPRVFQLKNGEGQICHTGAKVICKRYAETVGQAEVLPKEPEHRAAERLKKAEEAVRAFDKYFEHNRKIDEAKVPTITEEDAAEIKCDVEAVNHVAQGELFTYETDEGVKITTTVRARVVSGPTPIAEVKKEFKSALATKVSSGLSQSRNEPPHVLVVARAGTGKTTTLVGGLQMLRGEKPHVVLPDGSWRFLEPSEQQRAVWESVCLSKDRARTVCLAAFNKSIAEVLEKRMPRGCEAKTLHRMGYSAVRRNISPNLEMTEDRTRRLLCKALGRDLRALRQDPQWSRSIEVVERLVGLCKLNLVNGHSFEELDKLCHHYDVEVETNVDKVFELVGTVIEMSKTPQVDGCLDYDDMIWLPVILQLPVFQFDLLLVDEFQDTNRCQQALAKRAGRRLILCGDPAQAIYGFAGADSESMPRMQKELEATPRGLTVLPLTVTYRCGKAIVEEAKRFVPDFSAHESNCAGLVARCSRPTNPAQNEGQGAAQTFYKTVREEDMVLCRANAPLVTECFRLIKLGKRARVQGRNIGQGLISLTLKLCDKENPVTDLISALEDWAVAEVAKERAKTSPSENKIQNVKDKVDCIMCFAHEPKAKTVGDVVGMVENMFRDMGEGVLLSSVHKAKGLESDRVFILSSKGPPMERLLPWEREQEDNLRYVAITRAIKELYYVS